MDLLQFRGPGSYDRFRSRVRGLPEFGGELPSAAMAEDMLAGGEDRIRGMVTVAGNPVLSTPNGRQLDEALAGLDSGDRTVAVTRISLYREAQRWEPLAMLLREQAEATDDPVVSESEQSADDTAALSTVVVVVFAAANVATPTAPTTAVDAVRKRRFLRSTPSELIG